jgi:hypothetical protein
VDSPPMGRMEGEALEGLDQGVQSAVHIEAGGL